MKASDLATVGYLHDCFQTVIAHLEVLRQAVPAVAAGPPPQAVLLTIEQVMERTGVSRSAVQRWIKNGKKGRGKQLIKLAVLTFGDAEPRIPWPALLAFGRGEAYDLAQLPAPPPPLALAPLPATEPDGAELPPMRRVA
jgi:transcriptional regulator with XRE-family HTH domain